MQNMPQADLKTPGTTAYDTFMAPLVEECVGTGKLSGIVDKLMNDDRYKWVEWCCCRPIQHLPGRRDACTLTINITCA
jgi:hypothetical protein